MQFQDQTQGQDQAPDQTPAQGAAPDHTHAPARLHLPRCRSRGVATTVLGRWATLRDRRSRATTDTPDGFRDLIAPPNCRDRWRMFRRLQELDIACACAYDQPLRLRSLDPLSLVQLWSICRQCRCDRDALVDWLTTCWQQPSALRHPQDR